MRCRYESDSANKPGLNPGLCSVAMDMSCFRVYLPVAGSCPHPEGEIVAERVHVTLGDGNIVSFEKEQL
jgi:hypothetical protein